MHQDEKEARRLRLAETFWEMNFTDERAGAKKRYLKIVLEDPREFAGKGWQPYRDAIKLALGAKDLPIQTEVVSAKEYLPATAQPEDEQDKPVTIAHAAPKLTAQAQPEPSPQLDLF